MTRDPWYWAGVGPPIQRKEITMPKLRGLRDALKSAALVWLFTTVGLWIPGLLGWINEVTKWADAKGAPAFPDPSNLAYLFIAALTAAFPAAVAGIVRLIENTWDLSLLPRTAAVPVSGPSTRREGGYGTVELVVGVLLVVILVVVLFRLL
jgi:hypothetical protein